MAPFFHKLKLKLIIIAVILFFLSFIYYMNLYFTFDNINENKELILKFVNNNYSISILILLFLSIFFINSPIPMSALFMITMGFLFGDYIGFLLNLISVTFASYIGFLFTRYLFRKDFEKNYLNKLKKTKDEIEKYGFFYFLSARFIFIFPNFLINISAGLSKLSHEKFVLSTMIGSLLFSAIYANIGYQLKVINNAKDIFNLDLLFSLLFFAIISLLPIIFEKYNKKTIINR